MFVRLCCTRFAVCCMLFVGWRGLLLDDVGCSLFAVVCYAWLVLFAVCVLCVVGC